MKKEFIPYKQALALKELGFDEPCLAKYQKLSESANYKLQLLQKERNCNRLDTAISAPLYQQAFRWFREKYGFYVVPQTEIHTHRIAVYFLIIKFGEKRVKTKVFDTYEETKLECLKKLIEICKKILK